MSAEPSALEPVHSRPYRDDADFRRIRQLAIDTYPIIPVAWNWDIRRWEGLRHYAADPAPDPRWREWICLWETLGGRLVGVANPEGRLGEAFLQLHPDYRHLEEEMVAWCEEHLSVTSEESGRRLWIYVHDYDLPRRSLLRQRGYVERAEWGVARRWRLGGRPWPVSSLPAGYLLRETRSDPTDDQGIADLLNAAFGRTSHTAAEFRGFTTNAPSYRRDLDLVAQAPGGGLACYVGITWDPPNRRGMFEPVCTHPDHRRRGLALAVMGEGLGRLRALGALDAFVESGSAEPANALYDRVGCAEAYAGHYWRKALPG
ncbi:MAG TPA: GNAT family N-acetyltransferase [Acidimicrobiia bacterium]|nr:GNAT family N-acetyltransferase [Acidimicrobiia bacterium]